MQNQHTIRIGIGTLGAFLMGRRTAIHAAAGSRNVLWLGLLFVLSAGLAREYDGEDILHEPWFLVVPLGASLATSFVLYGLVYFAAIDRTDPKLFFLEGYRTFLGFYWLTAPLAWLYAIPVERFLSPGDATSANLWLLGVVALWRVALMTRVISVWLGTKVWQAFFIVMLFGDTGALLLMAIMPVPIWNIMGGVRHTPSELAILNLACNIRFFGGVSWIVWGIGTLVAIAGKNRWALAAADRSYQTRVGRLLWLLAIAAIGVGSAVLPFTQHEQQRRTQAEWLLRSNQLDEALAYMSLFERDDFPPHWDPPPRVSYGERRPNLIDVFGASTKPRTAPWVQELILEKLVFAADGFSTLHLLWAHEEDKIGSRSEILISFLESKMPNERYLRDLSFVRGCVKDERLSENHRARIRALWGIEEPVKPEDDVDSE